MPVLSKTYSPMMPFTSITHTTPGPALQGRESIVANWLDEPDDPDGWEASYRPYAIDGDRAVAVGWSRYLAKGDQPEETFHNVYLLRFASDGRCSEFTEYYVLEPSREKADSA